MRPLLPSCKLLLPLLASSLCFAAQADRISGPIDSSQTVALARSVHPKAQPQYDQGQVEPSFPISYVTLVIAPSPSQQAALDLLLAQQQNRQSPNYHKWLTPEQYAERFGLSQNDVNKITAWLRSQGLTVLSVARGHNSVIFSGTAGQIQNTFQTQIHRYDINGERHVANSTAVMVPAALGGVVTGIRGLTDFRPKPMYVRRAGAGASQKGPHPAYTITIDGQTDYFLAPGDIATIYDINPLYNTTPTPIDGTGQQLAIIGQTDIYLADINDFRSGFGFNQIGCTTNSSGVVTACDSANFQYALVSGITDLGAPSTCGDLVEADLDIEWSGATARNAQIVYVNAPATFNSDCTEITNGGGVNAALAYAIDNLVAPVISMSYGGCEGESEPLETELQQGNSEGITIMNSAGDTGAAACDNGPPDNAQNPPYAAAVGGLAVSYPASSPEVTGVGGTEISLANDFPGSPYWSNVNGSTGGSAVSYIPEIPWNDDVALAQYCQTYYSESSFCTAGGSPAVAGWVALESAATAQQVQEDIWLSIGGGGVSNCYNETEEGICVSGFPQPTFQQSITIPNLTSPQSTYRFVPDVSLLASPNFPGYILCTPENQLSGSGTNTASTCANGIPAAVDAFSIIGGTSASSPIFAGVVTLLNQYLGSDGLGNINSTLYTLAASPANGAFHQITTGENDAYCQEETPAGQPADVICPSTGVDAGIVGFSASNFDSTGHTGYNLVTGLGSVDVNKLAIAWTAFRNGNASSVTLSPSATNVTVGTNVALTAVVTPSAGVGAVSFSTLNSTTGLTTVLGTVSVASGTAILSTTSLPGGTNNVTATYQGDASHNAASSAPAGVMVTGPDFTLQTTTPLTPSSISAGQSASAILTIAPVNGSMQTVNFTSSSMSSPGSCSQSLPPGALCTFNPTGVTLNGTASANVTVTITTAPNMVPTTQTVMVTGTPSGAGGIPHSAPVSLVVTPTQESFAIAPTNGTTFTTTAGGSQQVQMSVTNTGTPSFIVGSGAGATTAVQVTYTCTGSPNLATAEITCTAPNNGQPTNATAVTVTLQTTGATTQLRRPFGGSRLVYAFLLPGLFGIFFAAGPRRRGVRLLSMIVVLGCCTLGVGSCGGNSGGGGVSNPGTPAGNYTVTINATTGGAVPLTASTTFTLSVSQ